MDAYEGRVVLLRSDSERFERYLSALPDDAWSRQSACDRWQVADVVAHLVGVAEFYAGTVTRGVQGDTSTPEGRAPAGSANAASSSEGIARGAVANRERLGDQLLSTLSSRDNHLNEVLVGLRLEDRDKPCYHPGGFVPAGNFVDMRFKELALHDWDIRSSLEPEAGLSPASLPSMMLLISNSLASGSLPWAFWPGPNLSTPVRYRFDVTQPVQLRADVAVEGDKVRLEESGGTAADVSFRCDTETFLLLIYGRLAPGTAIASKRLAAEGDDKLTAQFSQWFKVI